MNDQPLTAAGVLAGDALTPSRLLPWVNQAPIIFAADGGADALNKLGLVPDVVVGDLDSIKMDLKKIPEVVKIVDQNFTDCEKLLLTARNRGYRHLVLAGTEGSLPDHEMGSMQACMRAGIRVTFVYERGIGRILIPGVPTTLPSQGRVSLLPLKHCEGVSLKGVKWPFEDWTMSWKGRSSVSNIAEQQTIHASITSGSAFFFTEWSKPLDWSEVCRY